MCYLLTLDTVIYCNFNNRKITLLSKIFVEKQNMFPFYLFIFFYESFITSLIKYSTLHLYFFTIKSYRF